MRKLVVLVLFVAVVWGLSQLPWYLTLAVVAVLGVVARFAVPRLLRKAFVAPFKAKSRVLAGADANVHGVTREAAPQADPDAGSDGPAEPREHYCVELTITPRASEQALQHWEPGELRFVAPDARPEDPESDDSSSDADALGELGAIELFQDGRWETDEGFKFRGPLRLRLHVAVKPGATALKLRYYFEDLGLVPLTEKAVAA